MDPYNDRLGGGPPWSNAQRSGYVVITLCQSSIEAKNLGVAWSRSFGPLVRFEAERQLKKGHLVVEGMYSKG